MYTQIIKHKQNTAASYYQHSPQVKKI